MDDWVTDSEENERRPVMAANTNTNTQGESLAEKVSKHETQLATVRHSTTTDFVQPSLSASADASEVIPCGHGRGCLVRSNNFSHGRSAAPLHGGHFQAMLVDRGTEDLKVSAHN